MLLNQDECDTCWPSRKDPSSQTWRGTLMVLPGLPSQKSIVLFAVTPVLPYCFGASTEKTDVHPFTTRGSTNLNNVLDTERYKKPLVEVCNQGVKLGSVKIEKARASTHFFLQRPFIDSLYFLHASKYFDIGSALLPGKRSRLSRPVRMRQQKKKPTHQHGGISDGQRCVTPWRDPTRSV